jgi:hypothetical protein
MGDVAKPGGTTHHPSTSCSSNCFESANGIQFYLRRRAVCRANPPETFHNAGLHVGLLLRNVQGRDVAVRRDAVGRIYSNGGRECTALGDPRATLVGVAQVGCLATSGRNAW